MPYTFGSSTDEISNSEWNKSGMETHASVILFNRSNPDGLTLGHFKNNCSVTHGAEHAEDVVIRNLKTIHIGVMLKSPNVNEIVLNISKSPCSSTFKTSNKGVGCAEELIAFQNNPYICPVSGNEYIFKVVVIARAVYKQSADSKKAIDLMRDNGITTVTDVFLKKNGDLAAKAY